MKELSPQAREYLEALRTLDTPPDAAASRVWDGVLERAAAGDLGPELPAEPSGIAGAGGSTSFGSIALAVIVGAAVAVGVAVAFAEDDEPPTIASGSLRGLATVRAETPHEPDAAIAPDDAAIDPDDAAIELDDDMPAGNDDSGRRSRPGTRAPARTLPRAEPKPAGDPVAEEVALLAEARSALGAGEASRAIGVLARHRKRFPNGLLARERDVSWITALCVLGRTDEARKKTDAFLRAHGSSPHAAKVRASCGGR